MSKEINFTQSDFKHVVTYNPETGQFFNNKCGKILGTFDAGYYKFQKLGVRLMNHQWAWFYIYGIIPDRDIDHINGDRSDNRISNLRVCDHKTNLQDIRERSRYKKSGLKLGVSFNPNAKRQYRAHLYINGKATALGSFMTEQEAHDAYVNEKRKHHPGFMM